MADAGSHTLKGEIILSRTIGTDKKFSTSFPEFQEKLWFTLVSSDLDEDGQLKTSDRTQIQEAGTDDDDFYQISLSVPSDFGKPGALLVESENDEEFYLQTVSLKGPDGSDYVFACNSWVNKTDEPGMLKEALEDYKKLFDSNVKINFEILTVNQFRTFFINKACLPKDTPEGLKCLRALEMELMRGDGTGERKPSDRIYEYDVYNDLGNPFTSPPTLRPTLGGPGNLLYPRRCRTGRKVDEATGLEILPPLGGPFNRPGKMYVPRDEDFSRVKESGNNADLLNGILQGLIPLMKAKFDVTPDDFDTLLQVYDLYKEAGVDLFPKDSTLQPSDEEKKLLDSFIKNTLLAKLPPTGVPIEVSSLKYPVPQILQDNTQEWMSDEEFGRQTVAGMNPVVIRRATTFPPTSSLPEDIYGHGTDLTPEDIEPYLITNRRKITAQEAIRQKRLFTIDYHDVYLPYVYKINHENLDDRRFTYAPRAFFFLTDDKQMKPVAIELSLPPPQKGELKPLHRVFTPPKKAHDYDFGWQLAKMHFSSVDFAFHELVSHWLKCHAVVEPFIIASHRQLSAMHPIFVLLEPSFVNTMRINANSRGGLIAAAPLGPIENTFTPGKYANELSAVAYDKFWRFDKVGLPYDLMERGMADPDPSGPDRVKLLFDDYPFAKDALDVWHATKQYVTEYVKVYYETDEAVASDEELQAWWKEIRVEGHADKKDADWWPSCNSIHSLINILCTILYMTGPQHAGVNFGQYAYAGFMPNQPPMTRLPIPEPNTPEYKEMLFNFERYMLRSGSSPEQTITSLSILSTLSVHAQDEEYLGQRHDKHWTSDPRALEVFNRFSDEVEVLDRMFKQRNENRESKNRFGALKSVGYTLMYPKSGPGMTGKGIPWSISI